ncbi:MAG: hypothetical protein V4548_13835 [Bacteroidota bacterium]
MTSKINASEFKERLKENTQKGMPIIKVSPFALFTLLGKSKKKFFGSYTDNSFRFTKNTSINVIPQTVTGTFENINDSETKVDYHIETIWFGWLWLRSIPLLIAGITYAVYWFQPKGANWMPSVIFVDFFFLLLHFWLIQTQKKDLIRFENDFKKIFEITDKA